MTKKKGPVKYCAELTKRIEEVEEKLVTATSFEERVKYIRERSLLQSKRIAKAERETAYKPDVNMPEYYVMGLRFNTEMVNG